MPLKKETVKYHTLFICIKKMKLATFFKLWVGSASFKHCILLLYKFLGEFFFFVFFNFFFFTFSRLERFLVAVSEHGDCS